MIENFIQEYLKPIVLIIGQIEFTKRLLQKGLSKFMVMQICFCFVSALIAAFRDDFTLSISFLFAIGYEWLLLISITSLFYDLVVKKIRNAGGRIQEK